MRFTLKNNNNNNINSFEDYLKTKKKSRNTRQILCYAQRYSNILDTGDASPLVNLSSGSVRRHAMEALTAYSKHLGCYDRWQQIRKRYSLHWTDGNESLQALQRFFNPESTLEIMLQQIRQMIKILPPLMGSIIKFGVLTGLRPSEVVESVRLLASPEFWKSYYNPERQALEHFRFPEIFLRLTKKAYISFVTPSMISEIIKNAESGKIDKIPTYNAIRLTCQRKGIKCDMRYCRKIFASWLRQEGIQPEIVDMLQGRVSQSVLTRHYLVPQEGLKEQVLDALKELQKLL